MAGGISISLTVLVFSALSIMAEGNIFIYTVQMPRFIEEEFRDIPANFGNSLPSEGLRAMVVPAMPRDGCQPLQPPPPGPNLTGKWVVLIARYNCSFEVKVRNAQDARFDGVIVHNVNSSDLEIMTAVNPVGIKIPSVFVSEDTGLIIEKHYIDPLKFFFVINGDIPFNVNTHLLLPFAIIVGLCLIIIIVIMVVKCMRDRRRERRYRLPNSSLKKIPTCKFTKGDPYDTCAICLDDYVEGDKLRVLPCGHAYHCKCIDPWLTKNRRVCPVCKRKVALGNKSSRRRGAPAQTASNTHDSHSGSDTDDDQAPLINPRATPVTQGGTFGRPFTRDERVALVASLFAPITETSPSSNRSQRNVPERDVAGQRVCGSGPETSGSTFGAPFLAGVLNLRGDNQHQPNRIPNTHAPENRRVNPFASEDAANPMADAEIGDPENSSKNPSIRSLIEDGGPKMKKMSKRVRSKRRGSDSAHSSSRSTSSAADSGNSVGERSLQRTPPSNVVEIDPPAASPDRGLIGVAALPNVQNLQTGNGGGPSGNDFIV